jgi:hypothetical protein
VKAAPVPKKQRKPRRAESLDFPAETIARLLGITTRRLQQLAAEGWVPRGRQRGTYPLVGATQGYISYLRQLVRAAKGDARRARAGR